MGCLKIYEKLLLMAILPLLILSGCYFARPEQNFLHTVLISISTSLIASAIVFVFIDKKLNELLNSSDKIEVVLKSPNSKSIYCPVMTRREFSRSEVLGYIGMIKTVKEKERFKIESTNSQDFVDRLHKIYQTKGDQTFEVECTDEEMTQFDIGSK